MTAVFLAVLLTGPVPCDIARVLDGDTVQVVCRVWLGSNVTTLVRVRGIDTPEKKGKCPAESALAIKASKFTTDALPPGTLVRLARVDNDKYGGRVVADVFYDSPLRRGVSLADELIAAGLAREYDGGTKSSWCGP